MKTSREANNSARAIVAHVEEVTGKELPLSSALKITTCVQLALDAVAESRPRMNRKTHQERRELEKRARQMVRA